MPLNRRVRHLKLQDLHVLTCVAEAGSMAKAASALGLSQPSVSYTIANLEKAIGVPLLDRSPQGVSVTEYGRALIERGAAALNEMQHAVETIGFLGDPDHGHLRLGTTPPMSTVAAGIIHRLTRRHPGMSFHLINDTTTTLLRLLRQRDIEIAISRIVPPFGEDDIAAQTLFDDQLAVIGSRNSSWVSRKKVSLAELTDEKWVLPPSSAFLGGLIGQVFAAHRLEVPRATVTTTSTYAMAVLVATGPYLTIHPSTILTMPARHAELAALPTVLKGARHPVAVLTLKERGLSPSAELFLSLIREMKIR